MPLDSDDNPTLKQFMKAWSFDYGVPLTLKDLRRAHDSLVAASVRSSELIEFECAKCGAIVEVMEYTISSYFRPTLTGVKAVCATCLFSALGP